MISYVLPTRDRPAHLERTLAGLGKLDFRAHCAVGGGEVIVVDNASATPAVAPHTLDNGLAVRVLRRERNEGAAGRNAGAQEAQGAWIVMLDDDSHPLDCGHLDAIADAGADVGAIGADIRLPSGARESGGLPEVFIGCGVALRRDAFLSAAGYDPSFHFYVEEYDLSAKLLLAGLRVVHDTRFRVLHEKTSAGRDMNAILRRLVRNNAWIMQRYAPAHERRARIDETISRYGSIARKEGAVAGYAAGLAELALTLWRQPRTPMAPALFDRFTGLAGAREWLQTEPLLARVRRVAVVDPGKHDWAVRRALVEMGLEVVEEADGAEALVVGTLSPGPMSDAYERRVGLGQPALRPWAPIERASAPLVCA